MQEGLRWRIHGAVVKCYTYRTTVLAPVWTQRVQESTPWFRSLVTNKNQMTFLLSLHRRGYEALSHGLHAPCFPDVAILTFLRVCFSSPGPSLAGLLMHGTESRCASTQFSQRILKSIHNKIGSLSGLDSRSVNGTKT